MSDDLTLREAARILRLSAKMAGNLARSGRLPGAYRIHPKARWRVNRDRFELCRNTVAK